MRNTMLRILLIREIRSLESLAIRVGIPAFSGRTDYEINELSLNELAAYANELNSILRIPRN